MPAHAVQSAPDADESLSTDFAALGDAPSAVTGDCEAAKTGVQGFDETWCGHLGCMVVGLCQGWLCGLTVTELMAQARGRSVLRRSAIIACARR